MSEFLYYKEGHLLPRFWSSLRARFTHLLKYPVVVKNIKMLTMVCVLSQLKYISTYLEQSPYMASVLSYQTTTFEVHTFLAGGAKCFCSIPTTYLRSQLGLSRLEIRSSSRISTLTIIELTLCKAHQLQSHLPVGETAHIVGHKFLLAHFPARKANVLVFNLYYQLCFTS
jgi:hypothetical protein